MGLSVSGIVPVFHRIGSGPVMRVSLVSPGQHESLVDLLCELYRYYHDGAEVARAAVRAHLLDNLLAPDSALRLVVAEDASGTVAGFAAVMLLYSLVDPTPAHRRQCMMKELFVRADSRSRGVGRALMAWIARDAAEQGCGRIDWHVKASNEAGIRFYAGLGAERVADRLSYRLPLDPAAGQDVMRFQPDRTAAFIRSHVDEPLLP
jgi:ribosomal protein S18 acetylase RimI-like enzyme